MKKIKIVAVLGSLRAASLHKQLLIALQKLAPQEVDISILYLNDIPLYNQDVEAGGYPAAVQAFREAVQASDGIIFATPEYNGSMSGVLKNGIDWLSREGLLFGKPVAGISGSPGALGATKAHEHLRQVVNHLGMNLLSRPMLAIPQLHQKLKNDSITDEKTVEFIESWLETFRDWIIQLNK